MSGVVSIVIVGVLVLMVAIVARGSRPERLLAWFCFQYDIEPAGAARDRVLRYLRRTRRWRVAGAVGGIAVSSASRIWLGIHELDLFTSLFGGWFVAGILAELTSDWPESVGRRAASLAPRRLADFLPPMARHVLTVAGITATAAVTFALGIGTDTALLHRSAHPLSRQQGITGAVVAISISVIAWLGILRTLRKPYPVDDPDLDAAEYAIRIASVVRVVAGWSVLLFLVAIRLARATAAVARSPWSWPPGIVWCAGLAGVVVAWAGVPTRVVRRSRHRLGAA